MLISSKANRTIKECLTPTLAKYHPQEDENDYESLEIKGAVQSTKDKRSKF